MKSDFGTLAIAQDDGVVEVILNRPKVRNAISHQMQAEIDVALDEAEIDPEVKAVVLRGEGAVFSAGHDLKEQMAGNSFPALTFPFASPSISPRLPRAWYFRKPLIGAVHGYVGPYAIALVACCDFNIAGEHTRFSCEVFRSSYPDVGWLPLYMQLPMRVIEKLWLMGGWMDAEQALQFQFVQRVLPQDDVTGEALRWAHQAAQIPTETFAHSKEKIRRSIELLGLNALPAVLTQYGPPHERRTESGPGQFSDVLQAQGLKEAVRLRDQKFDPDITRV